MQQLATVLYLACTRRDSLRRLLDRPLAGNAERRYRLASAALCELTSRLPEHTTSAEVDGNGLVFVVALGDPETSRRYTEIRVTAHPTFGGDIEFAWHQESGDFPTEGEIEWIEERYFDDLESALVKELTATEVKYAYADV